MTALQSITTNTVRLSHAFFVIFDYLKTTMQKLIIIRLKKVSLHQKSIIHLGEYEFAVLPVKSQKGISRTIKRFLSIYLSTPKYYSEFLQGDNAFLV